MTVEKKHLAIFPTRHGFLFLAILGGMLAGSINYNNNAGFILVFLLGGMALISVTYSLGNLMGLDIAFLSAPPVFAGQKAEFHIQVRSPGEERVSLVLFVPKIVGSDKTSGQIRIGTVEDQKIIQIRSPAPVRGWMAYQALTLDSVYPFGLFRIQARVPLAMGCLVYPAPLPGPARASQDKNAFNGRIDTRQRGVDDFQGLAPYQFGQDVGRMAWKAVSRGQGLFVKDFTARADRSRIFDFDAVPGKDTEYRLSRLCHMVLQSDRNRESFGLKLPGTLIPPGEGPLHTQACLRALALFGREDGRP